jgi:hypothetical protein
MLINKEQKLEKAVSTNHTRPKLQKIHFDGEKYLTATNGSILGQVEVDVDKENDENMPALIPVDIYKQAGKNKTLPAIVIHKEEKALWAFAGDNKLRAEGEDINTEGYPDISSVVDPAREVAKNPAFRVSLNPKLLYDLAQAMGCKDHVTLSFEETPAPGKEGGYEKAIAVTNGDKAVFGIIMARRTE